MCSAHAAVLCCSTTGKWCIVDAFSTVLQPSVAQHVLSSCCRPSAGGSIVALQMIQSKCYSAACNCIRGSLLLQVHLPRSTHSSGHCRRAGSPAGDRPSQQRHGTDPASWPRGRCRFRRGRQLLQQCGGGGAHSAGGGGAARDGDRLVRGRVVIHMVIIP